MCLIAWIFISTSVILLVCRMKRLFALWRHKTHFTNITSHKWKVFFMFAEHFSRVFFSGPDAKQQGKDFAWNSFTGRHNWRRLADLVWAAIDFARSNKTHTKNTVRKPQKLIVHKRDADIESSIGESVNEKRRSNIIHLIRFFAVRFFGFELNSLLFLFFSRFILFKSFSRVGPKIVLVTIHCTQALWRKKQIEMHLWFQSKNSINEMQRIDRKKNTCNSFTSPSRRFYLFSALVVSVCVSALFRWFVRSSFRFCQTFHHVKNEMKLAESCDGCLTKC